MSSRARANIANSLVTLVHFLEFGSVCQPNIGWPIRIEELHNRTKELEVEGKADTLN